MTRSPTVHDLRRRAAEAAFRALGPSPGEHALLVVHCARGHHVAGVYPSVDGPVYVGVPWAHGHGARDRHDAAHHGGHRDVPWIDWLEPGEEVGVDDPLPAGCECGMRSLSRRRLVTAVADRLGRMVID
jgi:hypothetical protein